MNDLDVQFRASIEAVRQANSPGQRRLALNALLRKLQKLPDLLSSSHQNYPEALNQTWNWVCQNIDRFNADDENIAENLKHWINSYLKWRIRDLYSPDEKYIKLGSDRIKVKFVSIDQPLSTEEGDGAVTMVDRLTETEARRGNLFLDSIDSWVRDAQTEEKQSLAQKLVNYIEQDPDQQLSHCHPKHQPRCNAQFLAMRLYLQDPPATFAVLSDELQIPYQTLNTHWKRKCKKLLKEITQELSDEP